MLMGALIIGIVTGGTAGAVAALGIGAPLWVGLLVWSLSGSAATVLALALHAYPGRTPEPVAPAAA